MADSSEGPSIWWWAFGYFACYVPYTALTKMLSKPLIDTGAGRVGSLEILPSTAMASVVAMVTFLVATGWWRHAGRRTIAGRAVPLPRKLTILSGLCSSGIIATTTLAYTLGASALILALFMRGGVLVIAPVIDRISRRKVRWFSWVALILSLVSLLVVAGILSWDGGPYLRLGDDNASIGPRAMLDVALYLTFYFVRLTLMSSKAKSKDPATNLRYFVEELMVSTPALVLLLGIGALTLGGAQGAELQAGFTSFFDRPVVLHAIAIGVLSQGTGIFGGLIFLDKRENTYCVPVNRASSVLAVLIASLLLTAAYPSYPPVASAEYVGAAFIIAAIGFLTIAPALVKRRAEPAAPAARA
jgi:hypothetical protein